MVVAAVVVSAFEVVEVVGSGEGLVAGSTELVLTIGCQVVEIVGSGEVMVASSVVLVLAVGFQVVGRGLCGLPVGSWITIEELLL